MIYLVQTDTTAGFCSKNLKEINAIKNRDENQKCLITLSSYSELKQFIRVPKKFKNLVRKKRKTTFIYPNNEAFRVVKNCKYAKFLDQNGWMYSSSANKHKMKFDLNWAKQMADIVVDEEFFESTPSSIFRLSKNKIKKIR